MLLKKEENATVRKKKSRNKIRVLKDETISSEDDFTEVTPPKRKPKDFESDSSSKGTKNLKVKPAFQIFENFEKMAQDYCEQNEDDPLLDLMVLPRCEFSVQEVPRQTPLMIDNMMVINLEIRSAHLLNLLVQRFKHDNVDENTLINEPVLNTFLQIYNKNSYSSVIFKSHIKGAGEEKTSGQNTGKHITPPAGEEEQDNEVNDPPAPRPQILGTTISELKTALNLFSNDEWEKDQKIRDQLIQPMFQLEGKKGGAMKLDDSGIASQINPEDPRSTYYLIKIKDLSIPNFNFPVIVYISLYCLRNKLRVTEEFSFVWNSILLPSAEAAETSARQCIIKIIEMSEDLALVARVSYYETEETFSLLNTKESKKTAGRKDGSKVKGSNSIDEYNEHNKRAFLWGGIRLFGRNREQTKQINLFTPKSGMDDEQILDSMEDKNKKKSLEGSLTISVETINEESPPKGRISPSYVPMKPFDSDNDLVIDKITNTSNIIKELQNFELDCSIYHTYVNNLYVWPIKIQNWKHKGSAQVSVRLLAKDDILADSIPNVYGSCLQKKYNKSCKSALPPAESKQTFFDEFKIKLPVSLTEKYHLLFTISNIDFRKGKNEIVGYSVLPLMQGYKLNVIETQEELPITLDISNNYISQIEKEKKDSTKLILTIKTKLVSSIFPKDKFIHAFFRRTEITEARSIGELTEANKNEILKFFFSISLELLKIMCRRDMPVHAKEAFLALTHIVKTVNSEVKSKQGKILKEYTQYMVDNFPKKSNLLHLFDGITKNYLACLKENHHALDEFHTQLFMLTLITRSMALYLHEEGILETILPRQERFSKEFLSELTELAMFLYNERTLLTTLAVFLRDLICLIDRGVVLRLVDHYLSKMHQNSQMVFMYALANHEFYMQLNSPTKLKIPEESKVDWKEFRENLSMRYFIAGKLVQILSTLYTTKSSHSGDIANFRAILADIEADERFKGRERQIRIGGMYFPYIHLLVDNSSPIKSMTANEKGDWLSCFIYIIRNTDKSLLRLWIKTEAKKNHLSLLSLFKECLNTFENYPTAFLYQVILTVLEVVSTFIQIHHKDLNDEASENYPIFKHIAFIFKFLCNQIVEVVELNLRIAHQLIDYCPKIFFPDTQNAENDIHDYLDVFMNEFIRLCNSDIKSIRIYSCALLYKLLRTNYKFSGNIREVLVRASIAISKIIGSEESNYNDLNESLNNIKQITLQDEEHCPDLSTQVKKMIEHMENLLQQNELIKQNSSDPEMLAALYHKIANGFEHSPKLRLAWLNNLKNAHVKSGNKCEAAQCKMSMAALLVSYLRRSGQLNNLPPFFEDLFSFVGPNLKRIFEEEKDAVAYKSENWTVMQLVETLEEAVKLFEEATLFELCLELYSLLAVLYKADHKKYQKLITTLENHKNLLLAMTDPKKALDRLIPVYFRVGFYGKSWEEELRDKQFIYKKDAKFSLPVMIKHMEEIFGKKYPADKLVILSGNKQVEDESLSEDKLYIQLAGVNPYVSPEEASEKVTTHTQNFNVDKFLFETAYSDEGKNITDDLATQKKKKTIFTIKYPFPYVENRIEVIHVEKIILSPIENAIELITTQTAKVHSQLEAMPTRINPLQQTLQGSVVPMVNPGPLKVCEIFLSPQNVGQYKQSDAIRLIDAMEMFIKKCGFAVKLNSNVMKDDEKQQKFTDMINRSYSELEKTVKNATEAARKALEDLKKIF